eukprot:SAG22_NODE_10512_length_530_cov_1.900232_1_plen_111_part_01
MNPPGGVTAIDISAARSARCAVALEACSARATVLPGPLMVADGSARAVVFTITARVDLGARLAVPAGAHRTRRIGETGARCRHVGAHHAIEARSPHAAIDFGARLAVPAGA